MITNGMKSGLVRSFSTYTFWVVFVWMPRNMYPWAKAEALVSIFVHTPCPWAPGYRDGGFQIAFYSVPAETSSIIRVAGIHLHRMRTNFGTKFCDILRTAPAISPFSPKHRYIFSLLYETFPLIHKHGFIAST